ncbi:hypothetical protein CRG98_023186 [Punica granatum]|uniref:Uncharacterized protein n=1 Tax=Punica granatum TaxID=22663 RepID=A0A2I0JJL3_PUNGR|nr:hypothetical protein CRG98_023186 [Punica granatum]
MSSVGTSKGVLEIAKFGLYVTVPVVLMYVFANNSKNLQKLMGNKSYIVYPPKAERPPSPEELREMAREMARKRNSGINSELLHFPPTKLMHRSVDMVVPVEDFMENMVKLSVFVFCTSGYVYLRMRGFGKEERAVGNATRKPV